MTSDVARHGSHFPKEEEMKQYAFVLSVFAFAILTTTCASPTPTTTPVPSTLTREPPAATLVPSNATPVPPTATPSLPSTRTPPPTGIPSPTTTPTPTPWPAPAGVTFDFDDKISAFDKSVIQDGIAIGQRAFGEAGPIIVYARTSLDALMDAYYRHEKISANNPHAISTHRLFENGFMTVYSTIGAAIYFYTSDRWLNIPQTERMRLAAHEYFHQIQFALSGRNLPVLPAPDWLVEGSADYESFRVFADYQFHESERIRDISKDMIGGLHNPLNSLDTMDQARAEDSKAAYTLGLVATEFLTKNYGEETILKKFWEIRATTRTWQDAFRSAFGITTNDFYNKFEEYRRVNFPSYCDSSGAPTTLAMRLERQLLPGSFHAFPMTYIPYVFCVTGTQVGTWTSAQKETGFKKPTGVSDAQINFCGGNCVVLAIRQDTLPGTYTFAVEAPDGRKTETAFQYTRPTPARPTSATPTATPRP